MPTYLVFARTEFEQPLAQQGAVDAEDERSAAEAARTQFGDGWVELSLIPSDEVRWILGPDPVEQEADEEGGGQEADEEGGGA